MVREGYQILWEDIETVKVTAEIIHVTERFDQYAQPIDPQLKTLRTGELTVSRNQLMNNSWPHVGILVNEESPLLHPDRAAAILRKYVANFRSR